MKTILEQITDIVSKGFEEAGYEASYGKVTVSNRPDLCEFQCNGAMAGAKAYHKAPLMIAHLHLIRTWPARRFEGRIISPRRGIL